jgi:hypothetical protein
LVHISGAFLTREPGMSLSQNCSRGWWCKYIYIIPIVFQNFPII